MGIFYYIPPPTAHDEDKRAQAVAASGLVAASGSLRLDDVVAEARLIAGTGMAAVTVILDEHCHVLAAVGFPTGITKRSTSFCGHAILQTAPLFCVLDAETDERFAGNPVVTEDPGVRFYVGVPLILGGHGVGAVAAFDTRPRDRLAPGIGDRLIALADEVARRLDPVPHPLHAMRAPGGVPNALL